MQHEMNSAEAQVAAQDDHALRQRALEVLLADDGMIHGSSDDIQKMMLQLQAQDQSEAEYDSSNAVAER